MTESKGKLNFYQFNSNPLFNKIKINDLYEETRDEQVEELDSFVNFSVNTLNKNIYDSYKSFFYRYQDYNQINR